MTAYLAVQILFQLAVVVNGPILKPLFILYLDSMVQLIVPWLSKVHDWLALPVQYLRDPCLNEVRKSERTN